MRWNIYGHAWAVDLLEKHIAKGNMRHAYLFSGPKGVGRRTLALRFAQAVNCTQPPAPGQSCGDCKTCRQIERMQYPDLDIVQSAEDSTVLKVDQVRELQRFVSLAPFEGRYRVALLLNFEEANANAQNALLKTLEEPNAKVLLLVTVDDADNLLPTITSRCELLRLRPMPVNDLTPLLEAEGTKREDAQLIARISGGRAGYARRLASDPTLMAARGEYLDELHTLLGNTIVKRLQSSAQLTRGKNNRKARSKAKAELNERLMVWLSFWRDVLLVNTDSGIEITNIDRREAINGAAKASDTEIIMAVIRDLEHAFVRIQSANLQLMLDNILMDWPMVSLSVE